MHDGRGGQQVGWGEKRALDRLVLEGEGAGRGRKSRVSVTRSQLSYWRYWRRIISLLHPWEWKWKRWEGDLYCSLLASTWYHGWRRDIYIHTSFDPNNGMPRGECGRIGFHEFYQIFSIRARRFRLEEKRTTIACWSNIISILNTTC